MIVNRKEGAGMKLIKVHLLQHFTTMIRLFGHPKNDTFIPKKNHKSKVKQHARRTCYQSIDFKLQTAKKDYEDCILPTVDCKILKQEQNTVIWKFVGIHKDKENDKEFMMCKMRSGVWFWFKYDYVDVLIGKWSSLKWTAKFFLKNDFISFASQLPDIDIIHGQTQYNCIVDNGIVKIHGDPTINHHNWVVVKVNDTQVLGHILFFTDQKCKNKFVFCNQYSWSWWTLCCLSFCKPECVFWYETNWWHIWAW